MGSTSEKRNESLRNWLSKQNAVHLWHGVLKIQGTTQISAYNINGRVVLIHEHSGGFEIYAPVSNSIEIDQTFSDAERVLCCIPEVEGEKRECEFGLIAAVGPFSDEIIGRDGLDDAVRRFDSMTGIEAAQLIFATILRTDAVVEVNELRPFADRLGVFDGDGDDNVSIDGYERECRDCKGFPEDSIERANCRSCGGSGVVAS